MSAGGAIMCSTDTSTYSQLQLNTTRHRKFSFPASFHSNILGAKTFSDINANSVINLQIASKRRLSNVGDVVTRKLSTTIGWRNSMVPTQEIVQHGRMLCSQYIRCRLKRSRLFTKKCGLQRLRSAASLPEGMIIREVFPELLRIGIELERMHPKLYTNVARQANGDYAAGIVITEITVHNILSSVGRSLFKSNVSWAKIVSLFAVAGGLAADCVRQNHVEFIPYIVETMGEIVEDELAVWINDNGGWIALHMYCKPATNQVSVNRIYMYITSIIVSITLFVLLFRWFGKLAFFHVD